jgi:hypothetical protein
LTQDEDSAVAVAGDSAVMLHGNTRGSLSSSYPLLRDPKDHGLQGLPKFQTRGRLVIRGSVVYDLDVAIAPGFRRVS